MSPIEIKIEENNIKINIKVFIAYEDLQINSDGSD
jgi:hypothetical protein